MKTIKATKKLFTFLTVMMLSVFIFSCEGEDGAIGPQGEQGAVGPQGEQGQQGEQGEPGAANVIYSGWTTMFPDPLGPVNLFSIDAPELTSEILDTGVVLVYGRENTTGDGAVASIPTTRNVEEYSFTLVNGLITINLTNNGAIGATADLQRARYVIIPGGSATASARSAANIDYSKLSYEEVVSMFNIKE